MIRGLLSGVVLLAAIAAHAEPAIATERVVYHIDTASEEQQLAALRVIGNHLNDVGDDNLELRVIVQGDGVSMLLPRDETGAGVPGQAGDRMQVRLEDLKVRGVEFYVCGNSMRRRHIGSTQELLDVGPEDVVQSGIAEIVRLQQAGYTYVKL